jgi:hypothetical protein
MKKATLTISLIGMVIGLCAAGTACGDERVAITKVRPETAPAIAVERILQKKPLVQIAVLLDTSGSMSGLIDQARAELWAIVNEFIFAKRGGVEPEVQVALYEYGKSTLAVTDGYIRQIVPFTTEKGD